MSRKRILIMCVALGLVVTACSGVIGPKEVKVAISIELGYDYGKDMLNAAQLALKEANGKAGNVAVELVVYDTTELAGKTDLEKKAVTEAVKDPAIVAYLGPSSSAQAKVSMPILNQASMAQIASITTWPGLTKPGYGAGEPGIYYPTGRRHFFRTVPSDEVQGAAAARWAKTLGFKTAYLVYDTTAYAVGVAGVFELTAQDGGIQIVGKDTFDPEKSTPEEMAAIAARVVAAKPSVVYLGGGVGGRGEDMTKALRQADGKLPIIGPDAMQNDDLIKLVGADLVEGIYATNVGLPADQLNTPAAAAFVKSYQAAYGKKPAPYDVSTYEAMKALLYAIEHAKEPTRKGVLDTMQGLKFSGVLGHWQFDERGDISIAAISGMQVQKGAWVFVQIVE